jgi:hypothetical protein
MSDKYPFIPEYLTKPLEDISIPLIDIMHGYLKNEMLDCEEKLDKALMGEGYEFLQGYIEALTNAYCMTYNLSIDRQRIEDKNNE